MENPMTVAASIKVPPPKPAMKPPASLMPPRPAPPPSSRPASRPVKTFAVQPWTNEGQGKKILIYANSGMGKTTLASMAPSPIFIGLDDGGRMIVNPLTGQPVNAIGGIDTFRDMRDALHQTDLFPKGSTVVIDTITKAEAIGETFTFETTKNDKGETVNSIEAYGYGKGYKHLLDTIRLLLADLEPLVRRGVNILLLAQQAQATVSNLEGTDYLEDGPKLTNAKQFSVRTEIAEWVDHVFKIGHPDVTVVKATKTALKGKVSGSVERIIYTNKQLHYMAKSRPIDGKWLPPAITFESPADNSLWRMIFDGEIP